MKHARTVDDIAAIEGNWDTKFFRMTDHAKKLQFDLFMALACLETLTKGVEAAINRPKTEIQKAIELLEKEGLIVDGKILKQ